MVPRLFPARTAAHNHAVGKRPDARDRLVLACEDCPKTQPSRNLRPRPGVVAREIAAKVGADPVAVRAALDEGNRAERARIARVRR